MMAPAMNGPALILLRTTRVGPRERAFADELAQGSGLDVVHLVDGRHGPVPDEKRPVLAITEEACHELALPLVDHWIWRCGDYGLYLAKAQYPNTPYFWLIEGDVRFSRASDPFFATMAQSNADLLAGYLAPADRDWFWHPHGRGRDVTPYRCLYSAIRVSSRLVAAMLEKRQRHGRSPFRRTLWSNDEVFTATTAVHGPFTAKDFNDVSGPWYTSDYFEYSVTLDGDHLPEFGPRTQLLHSVRYGVDYQTRKTNPPLDQAWHFKGRRKLFRQVIRHLPW